MTVLLSITLYCYGVRLHMYSQEKKLTVLFPCFFLGIIRMYVVRRYCNVGKLPASDWAVAAWMWIRWSGPRGLTRKSASMLSAVLWPTRKGVRVGMEATGSRQWLVHPPQTSGWTGPRNNQWPCPVMSNGRRQYHGSSNTTWNENQPGYESLFFTFLSHIFLQIFHLVEWKVLQSIFSTNY